MTTRRLAAMLAGAALLTVAGCGGSSGAAARPAAQGAGGGPTAAQQAALATGAVAADTDAAGVEWLCRPGRSPDPCRSDLSTTVVPASGAPTVQRQAPPGDPPIDCFYVYPTVSTQTTLLADLHIDPAETAVAASQASRFSQDCRVYAPVYPQLTMYAIGHPGQLTEADLIKAYAAVAAAWRDYLARYNHGRGVVVIGHSQGASMLIALLRQEVDGRPAVRRLLVSAVILGGNVTVPVGRTVGGSFDHIPACTSGTETGCVVAYSSFDQAPPPGSLFGRPGLGVSLLLPLPSGTAPPTAGMQVLCVNPAAPGGGPAPLNPYFPASRLASGPGSQAGPAGISTPWITEPGLYQGECRYADGASWLQVSAPVTPGDTRAVVGQTLGPAWGLHHVDVNISLGNLVDLVARQSAAYRG